MRQLAPEKLVQIEAIADWRATPLELREHRSFTALARANGWHLNSALYNLADSAECYHRTLIKIAGTAMDDAPEILKALAERAKEGHVKAAEVYLNFFRQTITDEGLMNRLKPIGEVANILEQTARAAESLLAFAESLGDNEEIARAKAAGMVEPVDFEVVDANQPDEKPAEGSQQQERPDHLPGGHVVLPEGVQTGS